MSRLTNDASQRPPVVSSRRLTVVAVVALLAMFMFSVASRAQQAPVGLGTAEEFAVLAGSTITNTGPTTITGDVGLDPGTSVTGWDDVTHDGSLHVDDNVAEQAKVDLVTAYNDAASRTPSTTAGTELGGETLVGGVYSSESGTFEITGELTLDAQGDPDTVWVFQMASTLNTAVDSTVTLINGADACNVFWQVGSSATLRTDTSFVGTIMALESITLNTRAIVEGRVLARNAAVTMDTNTITQSACGPAPDDTASTPDDTASTPDDTASTPDDTASTPEVTPTPVAPIQPPTRIDTGAGGGGGLPLGGLLLTMLAVVAIAGAAIRLRRS
jgi:hypothetical protein